MAIGSQFSLEDFLSYFFPGAIATLGMYQLLLLTPLQSVLSAISLDIVGGVLLFIWGYVVGLIFSGISTPLSKWIIHIRDFDDPRDSIPLSLSALSSSIVDAYNDVFEEDKKAEDWSATQFFACRSLVEENMPNARQKTRRQNGLMCFRQNMVGPVLVWMLVGISDGIVSIMDGMVRWGIVLIIASVFLSVVIWDVLTNSMYGNRKREVRETYTAFLGGYRTGKLRRSAEDKPGKG